MWWSLVSCLRLGLCLFLCLLTAIPRPMQQISKELRRNSLRWTKGPLTAIPRPMQQTSPAAEHHFVDRQWSRVPRFGLRWSSSQQHSHAVRAVRPTRTKSTCCRQSSIRLHSAHTGSMLPTTLWGKSPCEVAESVIRRLQNTSSWTGSEAECRDAVCVSFSDGDFPQFPGNSRRSPKNRGLVRASRGRRNNGLRICSPRWTKRV